MTRQEATERRRAAVLARTERLIGLRADQVSVLLRQLARTAPESVDLALDAVEDLPAWTEVA